MEFCKIIRVAGDHQVLCRIDSYDDAPDDKPVGVFLTAEFPVAFASAGYGPFTRGDANKVLERMDEEEASDFYHGMAELLDPADQEGEA